MSQIIKTKGLIIRQVNYGEYDKMLSVLTSDLGKISVSAKGVRSMKNKNRAACELLCFNEFVLTLSGSGEVYSLRQCECIESFFGLRKDCIRLALGIYMADLAGYLSPEEMGACLKILLNSLFMLQDENNDVMLLKIIYDLKLLQASGFSPEAERCVNCGTSEGKFSFSSIAGGIVCEKCSSTAGLKLMPRRTLEFINYILKTPLTKALFKTEIDFNTLNSALQYVENFIAFHVREEIKTLEYLKKLVKMP